MQGEGFDGCKNHRIFYFRCFDEKFAKHLQIFHFFDTFDNAIGTNAEFFQKDHWGSWSWYLTDAHLLNYEVTFFGNDFKYGITNTSLENFKKVYEQVSILGVTHKMSTEEFFRQIENL